MSLSNSIRNNFISDLNPDGTTCTINQDHTIYNFMIEGCLTHLVPRNCGLERLDEPPPCLGLREVADRDGARLACRRRRRRQQSRREDVVQELGGLVGLEGLKEGRGIG